MISTKRTAGIEGDNHMHTNRQAATLKERTMKPSAASLIRWAGVSAMVAGIFFVVVGMFHPLETLASVTTTRWLVVHSLATAMCFFGILGMTGLYARQVEAAGWLGLAGYLLWSLFWVLALPFTFVEAFILPLLATEAPAFAEGFLGMLNRSAGEMKFGVLAGLWALSDILFLLGGLVFGVATLRAGILSRWAAGVFTGGIGLAPATALLPHELAPLVAVPIGLGLVWLGYALWSERREHAASPVRGQGSPQLRPTAAE
jgi:hypothetical protein